MGGILFVRFPSSNAEKGVRALHGYGATVFRNSIQPILRQSTYRPNAKRLLRLCHGNVSEPGCSLGMEDLLPGQVDEYPRCARPRAFGGVWGLPSRWISLRLGCERVSNIILAFFNLLIFKRGNCRSGIRRESGPEGVSRRSSGRSDV